MSDVTKALFIASVIGSFPSWLVLEYGIAIEYEAWQGYLAIDEAQSGIL